MRIKELVFQLLEEIEREKIDSGVAPTNVLRMDISRTIDVTLNQLFRDKRISVGRTINDKYLILHRDGENGS